MGDAQDLVWQQIHWPLPLDSARAFNLIRRLAADHLRQSVVFEARAVAGKVSHFVGTAAHQVRDLTNVIESMVPGVSLVTVDEPGHSFPRVARLHVSGSSLPLQIEQPAESARTLLGALVAARYRDEIAVLQIVFGRVRSSRLSPAQRPDPTQGWASRVVFGTRPASGDVASRLRQKETQSGIEVVIRVAASAASEGRRLTIMRGILAALRTVQTPGTRLDFVRDTRSMDTAPRGRGLHLSSSELLGLLAWPLEHLDLPGMPSSHPKMLRLTVKDIETERVFATTIAPGESRPIGVSIEDALYHSVLLGPTGSGKSTAMLNLILADIKAGRSVVVIDPKKDLVSDVLARIPKSRRDHVVVLDPSEDDPVGLNPLVVPGASPELIADGILGIFRELFPAFGPQVSDVTHASLLTLAQHPGATLSWLPRLFTDARFRRQLTERLDDPDGLEAFWEQYNELSQRAQAQLMAPVLSRLRQFLLRPGLKRVLDQSEPRFALSDLFAKPRILLVPINAGLLGKDAARLLGSLLVGQLWQLTLARAQEPPTDRKPVSIFVDEAQEFLRLGGDLADALARSRSLGVAWHLAHQFRAQMPSSTLAAIDANARNKIVFSLGHEDARAMAAMAPELSTEDFMALPTHAVYASLMRNGQLLGWISAKTQPPPPVTSRAAKLIAHSQARYGRLPKGSRADSRTTAATDHPNGQESTPEQIGRRPRP